MITIPSKSDKQRSILLDAFRLMAWQQFKIDNKVDGKDAAYEAYQKQFSPEWEKHDIHKKDLPTLQKLITDLGYSEEELLEMRSKHYERRDRWNNYKYTEWKAPHISPSTLNKDFKKTANHIRRLPTQRISQARLIRDWLGNNLTPNVAKKCLMWIKGCTRWACEEGIIAVDPFAGMTIRSPVKKEKRDRREPFTPGEKQQILAAFDDRHPHYGPYVRFLFLTGCRTSEANGLQWGDIGDDAITFQRARMENRQQQGLKTQARRQFPVNNQLRDLLDSLDRGKPTDFVFTMESGSPVDGHNFLNRIWRPTVKDLSIPYRPQYATRHTFITECLTAHVPVATIAAWVGNTPQTIYQSYAGSIPMPVPDIEI